MVSCVPRLAPANSASPSGAVRRSSDWIITSASRNSFHVHMKTSTIIVVIAGHACGSSTRHSVTKLDAPSSREASTSELGVERKNARIQNVPNGTESPIWGRISAHSVSVSPASLKT